MLLRHIGNPIRFSSQLIREDRVKVPVHEGYEIQLHDIVFEPDVHAWRVGGWSREGVDGGIGTAALRLRVCGRASVEVEVEVAAGVLGLVVVGAADVARKGLGRCIEERLRGAGLHVGGVVDFSTRHTEVEGFDDGVPGAAGEEAFEAGGEEGVDGGVVHGVVVGGGVGVGGAEVVKSVGLCENQKGRIRWDSGRANLIEPS